MKTIGIDVRSLVKQDEHFVKYFFYELLAHKGSEETMFIVYTSLPLDIERGKNIKQVVMKKYCACELKFFYRLLASKLDIFFTFEENYPLLYRIFQKNIVYVFTHYHSALYYSSHTCHRFPWYMYTIKKSMQFAKIFCFTQKTKEAINELVNVSLTSIEVIWGFFYPIQKNGDFPRVSSLSIHLLHQIPCQYIVYDADIYIPAVEMFFDAFCEVKRKLPLQCVVIGKQIAQNLELRKYLLKKWIEKEVIFVWVPSQDIILEYYMQSKWVVYPIPFHTFPFCLSYAVWLWVPLLVADNETHRSIFKEEVEYMNLTNFSLLVKQLYLFVKKKMHTKRYQCFHEYTPTKFVSHFLKE